MRRRRDAGDAGTDSFLDVLANLVGILVILVVITALRAAAPAPSPVAEAAPVRRPLLAPKPNVLYRAAPAPVVPGSLLAEADAATDRVADVRARLAAAGRNRTAAADRAAAMTAERERLLSAAKRSDAAADRAEREAVAAARALTTAKAERDGWALRLEKTREERPQVEPLEHRLLPVGRVVTGRELHFRLTGGPGAAVVRPVPVAELTDRLEADIRDHRDVLLLRGRYDGRVGPVGGYEMHYRVAGEDNGFGPQSRTRFTLRGWTLHSTDDSAAAPVPAALAGGSDFRFALTTAGSDATATFWVAPESFAAFREVRAVARGAGLTVAARPLPADVPISASPHGSRSVAQ